ncbi:hypothetical protein [Intestinibacillus sp. Marseille-P6563]|uniref:hypothetical protein n=1 Tax=Intestinibacillus sp. Marseille-P6563 TaxID=2364792 RepID=UPI000F053BB7|nr:hypothetical protein [Intestinibacillus sp. Marseille-P6563]
MDTAKIFKAQDCQQCFMLDYEVYDKLHAAEIQAASSDKRFTHEEVMTALRQQIPETKNP